MFFCALAAILLEEEMELSEVVTKVSNLYGERLAPSTANSSSNSATLSEFSLFNPDNRNQISLHGVVWSCSYTSKQMPPCI